MHRIQLINNHHHHRFISPPKYYTVLIILLFEHHHPLTLSNISYVHYSFSQPYLTPYHNIQAPKVNITILGFFSLSIRSPIHQIPKLIYYNDQIKARRLNEQHQIKAKSLFRITISLRHKCSKGLLN